MGEKFVKRRIEKAHGNGQTFHCPEYSLKVFALVRQKLLESLFAFVYVGRQYHLADCIYAVAFKEHMFRAAKPYTLGAELNAHLRLFWIVGVHAHAQLAELVGPAHNCFEKLVSIALFRLHLAGKNADDIAWRSFNLAKEDFAGGSVYRYVVAFLYDSAADGHQALRIIH